MEIYMYIKTEIYNIWQKIDKKLSVYPPDFILLDFITINGKKDKQ